jgi:acetylornithine deacetylase/succinyl-diaminopimelate desuccinylase-like protein
VSPRLIAALLGAIACCSAPAAADTTAEAKEILKRSIAFKTVKGQGQVPAYAEWLASHLKNAGFAAGDIVITPVGETAVLTVRFRGSGAAKPIVLLGHMDVVDANPADWERDPFTAVEENGYIYGRGAEDNKFDIAMMVATLAELKREGFKPRRDIILALSGAEETSWDSTRVLAGQLKDAELVLNGDGGGGLLDPAGRPIFYGVQGAEKTYADFQIEVTDAGGHSSAPTPGNPIHRLAKVLDRIASYKFAPMANDFTRASLSYTAGKVGGKMGTAMKRFAADPKDVAAADIISANPEFVGQVRTTCVATMINGGHALNALPQRATANVNCRIFPGVAIETVREELSRVGADKSARITVLDDAVASDASPLREDVMTAVREAVKQRYPGLEVTPSMSAGATDGAIFRAAGIPVYGVSGLFQKSEDRFAHGLNERIPVAQIAPALAHYRSIIMALAK